MAIGRFFNFNFYLINNNKLSLFNTFNGENAFFQSPANALQTDVYYYLF